jgi:hypothetical protein
MKHLADEGLAYRRLLLITVLVCIAVVATFPVWERAVAIPDNSRRIDISLAELRELYSGIHKYRVRYAGRSPSDLDALVKSGDWHGSDGATSGDQSKCSYYPFAEGEDPLVMCRNVINKPAVTTWVTASGRIYVGRQRASGVIWPKWEHTDEGLPIRLW